MANQLLVAINVMLAFVMGWSGSAKGPRRFAISPAAGRGALQRGRRPLVLGALLIGLVALLDRRRLPLPHQRGSYGQGAGPLPRLPWGVPVERQPGRFLHWRRRCSSEFLRCISTAHYPPIRAAGLPISQALPCRTGTRPVRHGPRGQDPLAFDLRPWMRFREPLQAVREPTAICQ